MKKTWIPILLSLFLLEACSFNKMFLFPYKLDATSTFSQTDEVSGDTLRLTFEKHKIPQFRYDSGKEYQPGYTIENHTVLCEGDSLDAWYIRSGHPNGQTIYYLHGNAGNLVYQYQLMTPFAERGYNIFMIDYQGFGFSGGETTRKNVYQAACAGFDYLLSSKDLRGEEIILYGQSLGGHLAISIANKYRDEIDLLVTEGAFSSHKDIASDRVPVLARIFVKEIYCAKDSIKQLQAPKLIIHSVNDNTVPFKEGELLFSKAAEPKAFFRSDVGHVESPLYYADSIVARMEALRKGNPVGIQSDKK